MAIQIGDKITNLPAGYKVYDAYPNNIVTYTGSWVDLGYQGYYAGNGRYTNITGDGYKFNFKSDKIIVTHLANHAYRMRVILDGEELPSVDIQKCGDAALVNAVVFEKSGLSNTEHSIELIIGNPAGYMEVGAIYIADSGELLSYRPIMKNKYLFKNETGFYKYQDGNMILIGSSINETDFNNYGLNDITGINTNDYYIVIFTPDINKLSFTRELTVLQKDSLIFMNKDIIFSQLVEIFKYFTIHGNIINDINTKIIFSIDMGETWNYLFNNTIHHLPIINKDTVITYGMNPSEFLSQFTNSKLMTNIIKNNVPFRLGFLFKQSSLNDNNEISSLSYTYDKAGYLKALPLSNELSVQHMESKSIINIKNKINKKIVLNYLTKSDDYSSEGYNRLMELIQNKVDIDGDKVLSTNDFTDELKLKLDSLNNFDDILLNKIHDKDMDEMLAKGTEYQVTAQELKNLILNSKNPLTDEQITLINSIVNKVDIVIGKQLSTNDFTDEYRSMLDNLSLIMSDLSSLTLKSHDKNTDLYLAQGTAFEISAEELKNHIINHPQAGGLTQNQIDNLHEPNTDIMLAKGTSNEISATTINSKFTNIELNMSNKVTKETGKGLSTNDFTNIYKNLVDKHETNDHIFNRDTKLAEGTIYEVTAQQIKEFINNNSVSSGYTKMKERTMLNMISPNNIVLYDANSSSMFTMLKWKAGLTAQSVKLEDFLSDSIPKWIGFDNNTLNMDGSLYFKISNTYTRNMTLYNGFKKNDTLELDYTNCQNVLTLTSSSHSGNYVIPRTDLYSTAPAVASLSGTFLKEYPLFDESGYLVLTQTGLYVTKDNGYTFNKVISLSLTTETATQNYFHNIKQSRSGKNILFAYQNTSPVGFRICLSTDYGNSFTQIFSDTTTPSSSKYFINAPQYIEVISQYLPEDLNNTNIFIHKNSASGNEFIYYQIINGNRVEVLSSYNPGLYNKLTPYLYHQSDEFGRYIIRYRPASLDKSNIVKVSDNTNIEIPSLFKNAIGESNLTKKWSQPSYFQFFYIYYIGTDMYIATLDWIESSFGGFRIISSKDNFSSVRTISVPNLCTWFASYGMYIINIYINPDLSYIKIFSTDSGYKNSNNFTIKNLLGTVTGTSESIVDTIVKPTVHSMGLGYYAFSCNNKFVVSDPETYMLSVKSFINNFYMVEKDSKNYKINTASSTLEEITNLTYDIGSLSQNCNSLSEIMNNINLLDPYNSKFRLVCLSTQNDNTINITTTKTLKPVVLESPNYQIKKDTYLSITKININKTGSNANSIIKVVLSNDDGITWYTYDFNTSSYTLVDTSNILNIKNNGLNETDIALIPQTALDSFILSNEKVKFKIYMEMGSTDTAVNTYNDITITANLNGTYQQALQTDYTIDATTSQMKITFNNTTAADFKINYSSYSS